MPAPGERPPTAGEAPQAWHRDAQVVTTQAIEIPGYVAGTWDLDAAHSHIGFVARHMMLNKVRGRFDKFEAQIVTAEDPLKSSATVTVDMNSVNTGNEARDDDLRSDNFFAAATYPVMTYRSTGIRRRQGPVSRRGPDSSRRYPGYFAQVRGARVRHRSRWRHQGRVLSHRRDQPHRLRCLHEPSGPWTREREGPSRYRGWGSASH